MFVSVDCLTFPLNIVYVRVISGISFNIFNKMEKHLTVERKTIHNAVAKSIRTGGGTEEDGGT